MSVDYSKPCDDILSDDVLEVVRQKALQPNGTDIQ